MTVVKPHISLQHYHPELYNVLVCRTTGAVFFAWSGSYKQAAYRQSVKISPSRDPGTYRCCIVRPGTSLQTAVNWVINGWQPPPGSEVTP